MHHGGGTHGTKAEPGPHGHGVIHWAGAYDRLFGPLVRLSDAAVMRAARLSAGEAVLDIGCGPGHLTVSAAKRAGRGAHIAGVDPSPEMIAAAQRKALRNNVTLDLHTASASALPFADGSFDVLLSRLAWHHIDASLKDDTLREIRRVLRAEGRAVLVDFRLGGTDVRRAAWDFPAHGLRAVERGSLGLFLSYVVLTPGP
jgi:ubiquinone/menaquinone biosynthesis C-methylase UbiE